MGVHTPSMHSPAPMLCKALGRHGVLSAAGLTRHVLPSQYEAQDEPFPPQRRPLRFDRPREVIGKHFIVPLVSGKQTPSHSNSGPVLPSGSQGWPKVRASQVPVIGSTVEATDSASP